MVRQCTFLFGNQFQYSSLLAFVWLLLPLNLALAADESGCLVALLDRSKPVGVPQERLEFLSSDPLIQELIQVHQREFVSGVGATNGSANWSVFDGSWVFLSRYRGHLDSILERLDPGEEAVGRRVLVLDWVESWEAAYTKGGVLTARSWNERQQGFTGKQRFVQKLLLEMAFRQQRRGEALPQQEPVCWSNEPAAAHFVDTYRREMAFAFHSLENFQKAYDVFFRKRTGMRLARPTSQPYPHPAVTATGDRAGISLRGIYQPWLDSWRRTRDQQKSLDEWLRAMEFWREYDLPLVPLFAVSAEGRTVAAKEREAVSPWGTIGEAVEALKRELDGRQQPLIVLGAGIRKGSGTANPTETEWRKELLVQACLLQLRTHPPGPEFDGFSVVDPSEVEESNPEPYWIVSTDRIWLEAGMSLVDLNRIVRLRTR